MAISPSRRSVLKAAAGMVILPGAASAYGFAANERVNVALVGVTGRGSWFVNTMPKLSNVVALCDVNDHRAGPVYQALPRARHFADFRKMLADAGDGIDAVVVATPDHTHAAITLAAIRAGKGVYCEKPLTHDLHEARVVRDEAAKHRVATQMGNQGTASSEFRKACEIVQSGALGEVREVFTWNDAGGRGRGQPTPERPPVPAYLHWDLWLGPAADRPYHPYWLQWHSWRDFATGTLGNWCTHSVNLAFKSLRVDTLWRQAGEGGNPGRIGIEAKVSEIVHDVFPRWEAITYEVPARGDLPPVRFHWCCHASELRQQIEQHMGRRLDWGDAGQKKWADFAGCLIVGSKGKMHLTAHNATFKLLPEAQFRDFKAPAQTLPRSRGHEMEWLDAVRGGPAAMSNFNYGAPLAEFVLLGNLATQVAGRLEYDPLTQKFAGRPDADALVAPARRKGWEL